MKSVQTCATDGCTKLTTGYWCDPCYAARITAQEYIRKQQEIMDKTLQSKQAPFPACSKCGLPGNEPNPECSAAVLHGQVPAVEPCQHGKVPPAVTSGRRGNDESGMGFCGTFSGKGRGMSIAERRFQACRAESEKRQADYRRWLCKIERAAMRSEWCIDHDVEYWFPKFARGLTAEQALNELWDDVNPWRRKQSE